MAKVELRKKTAATASNHYREFSVEGRLTMSVDSVIKEAIRQRGTPP
jgi:hypothetical protein